MKGKITLIGCPKLDQIDYSEKLTQIIAENNIKSVTVLRMEVPCCGGLEKSSKSHLKIVENFFHGRCTPSPQMEGFLPDFAPQKSGLLHTARIFIPVIPLIDESYLPLQYQRFLQWNYKIECTPISLFFFSLIAPKSSLTHSAHCPGLVSPVRIWRPAWLPHGLW